MRGYPSIMNFRVNSVHSCSAHSLHFRTLSICLRTFVSLQVLKALGDLDHDGQPDLLAGIRNLDDNQSELIAYEVDPDGELGGLLAISAARKPGGTLERYP